jgi:3-oxoadipate enol-lactonase
MWEAQARELAKTFRVLAYDVRGHGRTEAPKGEYSLAMMSDDLNELLEHLRIESCHFIGLSMGGMIGQINVLRPKSRFASLVLADTTGRWPDDMLPMWEERIRTARTEGMVPFADPALARWFTKPFLDRHPDVARTVREWIETTSVDGFVGACHAIPKVDALEQLKQVKLPCLVLVGAEDRGTPPEMSHRLHASIPGSKLYEIPNAAHLCNIEQPDLFNRAVLDFYASLPG